MRREKGHYINAIIQNYNLHENSSVACRKIDILRTCTVCLSAAAKRNTRNSANINDRKWQITVKSQGKKS